LIELLFSLYTLCIIIFRKEMHTTEHATGHEANFLSMLLFCRAGRDGRGATTNFPFVILLPLACPVPARKAVAAVITGLATEAFRSAAQALLLPVLEPAHVPVRVAAVGDALALAAGIRAPRVRLGSARLAPARVRAAVAVLGALDAVIGTLIRRGAARLVLAILGAALVIP